MMSDRRDELWCVKLKDEGFILKHVRNFFLEDLVETFGQMLSGFWIISLNICGLIFCWREISETLMEDSGEWSPETWNMCDL